MITQTTPSAEIRHLPLSLLLLRLGVFVVMLFWSLDKLLHPEHSAKVFENFYGIAGAGETMLAIIAVAQLVLIAGFVAGFWKTWTYGLVLAMHAVSTFSSWKQYMAPFDHLLFFAAWPMLAACVALFLLRRSDTLLSVDAMRGR